MARLKVFHSLVTALLTGMSLLTPAKAAAQPEGYRTLESLVADDRAGRATLPRILRSQLVFAVTALPLPNAIDSLARQSGVGVAYTEEVGRASGITIDARPRRVADLFLMLFKDSGWQPWVDAEGQLLVRRVPARPVTSRPGGERVRLSGYVREASSGELVRYATVLALSDSTRARTNADGFFVLAVPRGEQRIRLQAIGFIPLDTTLQVLESRTAEFTLSTQAVELQKVTVDGAAEPSDTDHRTAEMSVSRLDLATIKQTPSALGEVDPVRSLTLLPGVTRTSDASTAFNVRGGSHDQNLILLDEATIYNAAHILGFLSVFNADAVADATLYKGAIPPRLGGRLSSVLDVRQREGNAKEFKGSASIGILAARASVEGPLGFGNGSYLVTGRRSYADAFLKLSSDTSLNDVKAWFYDLNAKANIRLGGSGALMASGYVGRDNFSPGTDLGANWGNLSGTLRWNQIFKQRLFSKVSMTSGDYDYAIRFPLLNSSTTWSSRIRSQELRVEERFFLTPSQSLEFGAELANQEIRPGSVAASDTTLIKSSTITPRHGRASALYVGHVVDLGTRVSLNYGLRYSRYTRQGAGLIYQYEGGRPVVWNGALGTYQPGVLLDSTTYKSGEQISDYGGFEPRVSLRFGLNSQSSLKASYARTRQHLLLASKTNSPTPLDVWEPVGPYFKPQYADQVALGYVSNSPGGAYEFSIEGWAKRLYNVVDFVEGADVVLNPRLETALVSGVGRARGLELFLRKQTGATTGWISYTLSRSEQRFRAPDGLPGGLAGGKWYPSVSDKTHDLSVVALRPISRRWTLGGTFSLASGLPVSYPVSRYSVDGLVVPEYGLRNSSRLPLYHKVDLSLTRATVVGELQFGVFNLYNRFNAQSMSFRQVKGNPLRTEAVQTSVFGIVPSISYTFRF